MTEPYDIYADALAELPCGGACYRPRIATLYPTCTYCQESAHAPGGKCLGYEGKEWKRVAHFQREDWVPDAKTL